MVYHCCFSLRENLDFLDFLQKCFITLTPDLVLQQWTDTFEQEKERSGQSIKSEEGDEDDGGGPDRAQLEREEKFGKVMKRSGVAITVTSLTDFIAFAVGGTTVRKSNYYQIGKFLNTLGDNWLYKCSPNIYWLFKLFWESSLWNLKMLLLLYGQLLEKFGLLLFQHLATWALRLMTQVSAT